MLQPRSHAETTRARMEGVVLKIKTITNVSVKEDILDCSAKSVRDKMCTVNLRYKLTDFCGLSHGCNDRDH